MGQNYPIQGNYTPLGRYLSLSLLDFEVCGPVHEDLHQGLDEPGPPVAGVYIVPYSTPVGEEYQVLKEGRVYHVCGEEYNVDKIDRGSKIIFSVILRLFERTSSGKGRKFLGRKLRVKNGVGEEYKVEGNFIHLCLQVSRLATYPGSVAYAKYIYIFLFFFIENYKVDLQKKNHKVIIDISSFNNS